MSFPSELHLFRMWTAKECRRKSKRLDFFRHTFATECICRWMREGRDIDAMLPFLSAYMGHARYEDTLYYVHMVPDFYERVGTVDRTAWEKLLPEVHDEG